MEKLYFEFYTFAPKKKKEKDWEQIHLFWKMMFQNTQVLCNCVVCLLSTVRCDGEKGLVKSGFTHFQASLGSDLNVTKLY